MIRTATRRLATAAATVATAGVVATTLGASFPTAAHAEGLDLAASQASVSEMRASVADQLAGRVFGWQLSISQNGTLKAADEGGFAVSAADNNGVPVPMQASMRMELASVTKNVTAVATMKLLRRNNLTRSRSCGPTSRRAGTPASSRTSGSATC